ncbi:RNA polymerase sigma factor RpoD [Afipia carboxidovorans OM5]|nr:RNA polymerase sigma factor RpoD [Afipia carboxidovorans OM5]
METTEPSRAADQLPNPFLVTELEDNSEVRSESVERAFRTLSADSERAEGELLRSDIDRVYLRRKLTIAECATVEQQLRALGVRIVEDDEDEDNQTEPSNSQKKKYLNEMEERELGRTIRLAKDIQYAALEDLNQYERQLVHRAEKAKARFVESNLLYVRKLANRKRNLKHLTADDLFQEGLMGLLKATELFDPELGFRFKTYATWWIQQYMSRALDDGDRTIRLPVHRHEYFRKIKRKTAKLTFELGREPTLNELATELGLERERLAKLLWRLHVTECVEADAPIGEDTTVLSYKADESPSILDLVALQQLRTMVARVLATLVPREERIIRMRFGLDGSGEQTLEAIGNVFGVTRERIRQIEAKALRKLKHPSRSRALRTFLESDSL